jgi:hypothetical protein
MVRLGPTHLWLAGTLLLILVVVCMIAFSPVDTQAVVLPQYERSFGFQGGQLSVQDDGGKASSVYGLVTVDPAGPLGGAGLRSGDVPVAHHGGADELAWALRRSGCGETTTVGVLRASAGPSGRSGASRSQPDPSRERRAVLTKASDAMTSAPAGPPFGLGT